MLRVTQGGCLSIQFNSECSHWSSERVWNNEMEGGSKPPTATIEFIFGGLKWEVSVLTSVIIWVNTKMW